MTERTATSFGDNNYGLQVGQNSGPIHAAFHLPPGMYVTVTSVELDKFPSYKVLGGRD